MTSAITAFMVAAGGTSLVCYLLMSRVQNRKSRREGAGTDAYSTSTSAGDSSGGNSWNLLSWFGSDSISSHDSGSSSDFGADSGGSSGDSGGGGGDSGGGGGGD